MDELNLEIKDLINKLNNEISDDAPSCSTSSNRTTIVQNKKDADRASGQRKHTSYNTKQSSRTPNENIGRNKNISRNPENKGINKFKKKISFKYIENLLKRDVEEIVLDLNGNESFFSFLKKSMTGDTFILIVQLLGKTCECSLLDILLQVLGNSLSTEFMAYLCTYLCQIKFQSEMDKKKNSYFWKDVNGFWKNLIKIIQTMFNISPSISCDKFLKVMQLMEYEIKEIKKTFSLHISDNIITELNHLKVVMLQFKEDINKTTQIKTEMNKLDLQPSENFREILIYPNSEEIFSGKKVFLRKNIINQPYENVEQYLDIQFRLLREDFVGPLRHGINTYLENSNKKLFDIKIHKNVRFLYELPKTDNFCFLIQLDLNLPNGKKRKLRLEDSRQFMFGSLLCFTNDNFKTLLFSKVVDNDKQYLSKGQLIVEFDENINIDYDSPYIMVESTIFFEPYYQVLKALKDLNEDNLPMRNYIIDVDTSTIKTSVFDAFDSQLSIEGVTTDLSSINKHNFYNFNDSQKEAFCSALTNEFTLIQGPPGTGKTYVGIKVASTLIQNKSEWNHQGPMLVICYTNHALDQFLEGLINVTGNIIRVGGQSKSETLKQFSLKNKRFQEHSSRMIYHSLKSLLGKIKYCESTLSIINDNRSVLNFSSFKTIIPNFKNSWLNKISQKTMISWFMGENVKFESSLNNVVEGQADNNSDSEEDGLLDIIVSLGDTVWDDWDDDIFDMNEISDKYCDPLCRELINLDKIEKDIEKSTTYLKYCESEMNTNSKLLHEYHKTKQIQKDLISSFNILKTKLDKKNSFVFDEKYLRLENSQFLIPKERCNLYFSLLHMYTLDIKKRLNLLSYMYRRCYKTYSDSKTLENIKCLRSADVIGLTTTGAARLQSALRMIKSPIVIYEEAAEILEAHVLASLTEHCKQLILIGDHKQLRPSTSNYQMEKFYHLGISLFERMVLNKIQLHTLNIQHRMKPEIAALVAPQIYPNLKNHNSVIGRSHIRGIAKDVFFLHHEHLEKNNNTTKLNQHEAQVLVKLARHMILNGYHAEDITILSAYLGQMYEIIREKNYYDSCLKNVRVAVLDNYQGEECKIILLSLVRNNNEKKVGFLAMENRCCVALSRARDGLYMMGNIEHLCEASEVWKNVKNFLTTSNMIGTALPLRCEIHQILTEIKTPSDFDMIPEGGCSRICNAKLPCHHYCKRLCHILDREHENNRCLEDCKRLNCDKDQTHLCKKRCYEKCGPCSYKVLHKLECNHEATIPCYVDPKKYLCMEIIKDQKLPCDHNADVPCSKNLKDVTCKIFCETRLDCGHACTKLCHIRDDPNHLKFDCTKPCAKPAKECSNPNNDEHRCRRMCFEECNKCLILVKKKRSPCNHLYEIECSINVDKIKCLKPCKKIFDCGHQCQSVCDGGCPPCRQKIMKIIPDCEHKVKMYCCLEATRWVCNGPCPRTLSCGHQCNAICKEECDSSKCKVQVDVLIEAKCGHIIKKLECRLYSIYKERGIDALPYLHRYCREPCRVLLKCSKDIPHFCQGTCGECHQGRAHIRCSEKCGATLVCNHICQLPCREGCKPCTLPCQYKCKHSKCKKACGEPCNSCKEKCDRKCAHLQCKKYCGEICSVPPCDKPCLKILKCNHPCVGFCSEPCPPLCRECNKDELQEIFFGTEEDDEARFILLTDCGHVVENSGMEQWLNSYKNEIQIKACPKCKTPIINTARYSNFVKESFTDIHSVKVKLYGKESENKEKTYELLLQCNKIKEELTDATIYLIIDEKYSNFILAKVILLKNVLKKRNSKMALHAIKTKVDMITIILDIIKNIKIKINISDEVVNQTKFIFKVMFRKVDDITQDEMEDIKREINRLNRIFQFEMFPRKKYTYHELDLKYKECYESIHDVHAFDDEIDKKVGKMLKELNDHPDISVSLHEVKKLRIVEAMQIGKGRWFKCPNGHPYVIGECGGAMEKSKCADCGLPIGGTSHQLLNDNSFAPQMDNALHPAWSEANNLANFQY